MKLSPSWEYVSDRVMGGVSSGQMTMNEGHDQPVAHLTGEVSLDNNGGFVQMAFDLCPDATAFDASAWRGIGFDALGNDEAYEIRLRTSDLSRPWQSFRAGFTAGRNWQRHMFLFDDFSAHRTEATFDPSKLKRVGVLAIGRVFTADISVRGVFLFD